MLIFTKYNMVFIDCNNTNIENCNLVQEVEHIDGSKKLLYEHNNKFMTIRESLPGIGAIVDHSKNEFFKNTKDFENKDYYFYNYDVWDELQNNKTVESEDYLFRC